MSLSKSLTISKQSVESEEEKSSKSSHNSNIEEIVPN
jgi:hypothetical protein